MVCVEEKERESKIEELSIIIRSVQRTKSAYIVESQQRKHQYFSPPLIAGFFSKRLHKRLSSVQQLPCFTIFLLCQLKLHFSFLFIFVVFLFRFFKFWYFEYFIGKLMKLSFDRSSAIVIFIVQCILLSLFEFIYRRCIV